MKILSEKVVARGAGGREEGCEGSEKVARKREGWYSLQRDPGTPAGLSRGTSCRTAIPVLPAWKPCRICGDFRSQMFESQAKGCPRQAQALPPGSCVTLGKSLCLGISVSSPVARADLSLPCRACGWPGP
ncbi:unnamed protein product [Rangifer tarandus platyrhynchus]|uniref:Uncharacterized protein n=1 Tax=Rangifer tarandus platyrhynchus TaxID=3082113 RepID=A0ABN8YE67_RANTA|nr:unnamed protein product [Rangifer tarandus platyrhynchus]